MDNTLPISSQTAFAKAYTCIAMNISSREFRDKYLSSNDPKKFG